MKIRKAKKEDVSEAHRLVQKTFKKCNFNEGPKKSIQEYLDWHNPSKNLKELEKGFDKSEIYLLAVDNNEKIIGMIKGKRNKIGNLFVNPKYHRKGIAKKLVERFEKHAKKLGSNRIWMRSSLYAVPFYQIMGYKKTTGIKNFHGSNIQPMAKELK
jgi:N-acetylglutamate synthase-like GNAT family acetyltransferase